MGRSNSTVPAASATINRLGSALRTNQPSPPHLGLNFIQGQEPLARGSNLHQRKGGANLIFGKLLEIVSSLWTKALSIYYVKLS